MTVGGRILVTSKRPAVQIPSRKPVRGCYCNQEPKKLQLRSPKTAQKSHWPCDYCKTNFDLGLPSPSYSPDVLASPLSCDTLRKVQRINYTPRSEFLRRVQRKVCQNLTTSFPESPAISPGVVSEKLSKITLDYPPESGISSSNRTFISRKTRRSESTRGKLSAKASDDIETIFPSRRASKTRTVTSKTGNSTKCVSICAPEDAVGTRSRSGSRRVVSQTICDDDRCSINSRRTQKCPDTYRIPRATVLQESADEQAAQLRKFREKNYYDTHGSRRTLSSASSDSLEQFQLNDRLFPESSARVRRRDLVVTMPASATKELKRVHYFPRYVVKQEKNPGLCVCRKKSQTCPLTGHAVDLGVLKPSRPANSLALAFQKSIA